MLSTKEPTTMETNLLTLFVKDAVQLEPRRDSLHKLLKLAKADMTDASLDNADDRTSALNSLKHYLDPNERCDSSSSDESDEILLDMIKQVEVFYELCCKNLQTLPSEFHVEDKWPYLETTTHVKPPDGSTDDKDCMDSCLAYTCLNYLGAIAHGRETEIVFSCEAASKDATSSVKEVLDKRSHGTGAIRQLTSVEAAKKVIMEEGPVVSASFRLKGVVSSRYPDSFVSVTDEITHPVLIVGWKSTALGQQWLIRTHRTKTEVPVPIGHFSMEEDVIAPPAGCMHHEPWQDAKVAWDRHTLSSKSDWYSWTNLVSSGLATEDIQKLSSLLGCGFGTAIKNQTQIVIRDKKKIARSRRAYFTDVEWLEDKKHWTTTMKFISSP